MSELLVDSFQFRQIGNPMLTESTHPKGAGKEVYRVSGVFQNYLLKNQNGRLYPKNIWESILSPGSRFMERLERRNVLGMLEHPEDGITRPELASHVVVEVRIATPEDIRKNRGQVEEGDIIGAYEVLPDEFPKAKILRGMVEANIDFGGVSSRGNGTVSETPQGLVVNEDFELDTWDVVFTPSVSRAKPQLETRKSTPTFESAPQESAPEVPSKPNLQENPEDTQMSTPSAPTVQQESSFCLITGMYGPGPESEDKKFIPIELIQESTTSGSDIYKWRPKKGDLPKIGIFETAEDAVGAMKSHCEESGAKVTLNDVTGDLGLGDMGVTESFSIKSPTKSTTPMNPKERIREIQAETVRLTGTDVTNLRISERASLLGVAQNLQIELAEIVQESPALSSLATPLNKKLLEYEEELDAPAEPAAPEPEPAPAPAPEGDMGAEGGGEMTAEEAAAKLEAAIQTLRDCGKEAEANDLQGVADQLGDAMGGEAEDLGAEDEFGEEPVPEVPEDEFMESMKTKAGRSKVLENYNLMVNRYNRLARSSSKLLEQVESGKLSESSSSGGEDSVALREAQEHAQQCEEAAREVASRFNEEMIAFGKRFWELKRPELYETVKDRLAEAKTWEDFEKLSKTIISENEASSTPAANEPVAESDNAAGADAPEGNITESAEENGEGGEKPPVTESEEGSDDDGAEVPKEEDLEEEIHPALRSIQQSRLLAETGSPFAKKDNALNG